MADTSTLSPTDGARPHVPWYRRHRRVIAAVSAATIVAAGGIWWWSSSQEDSLRLPASACWSLVDRKDIPPPKSGVHGTFTTHYAKDRNLFIEEQTGLEPGAPAQACRVERGYYTLLELSVLRINKLTYHNEYEQELDPASPFRRLVLGPDVKGEWQDRGKVQLAFRCDFPTSDPDYPYLEIVSWGDEDLVDTTLLSVRHSRMDLALKMAKATAAAYACRNPVTFPSADAARSALDTALQE